MADKIHCGIHGEVNETFVCEHLLDGQSAGLGFNRNAPTEDDPYPDAWCNDCEIIRAAHDGWNDVSEKLTKISLLCAGCYRRSLIRNIKKDVILDDLADLRWKCGNCDEWHTGPCLDFGYDAPFYWTDEHQKASTRSKLVPSWLSGRPKPFLNEDYCSVDDENCFVRGVIDLPIIGTAESFRWGVWGSLSHANYKKLIEMDGDDKRVDLPPLFSWLSSQIPEYPDTLSLKMYAHIQEPGTRPIFELEETDHPLSQEHHNGISAERVKEIMLGRIVKKG
jgi:hypothetical protein